MSEITPAKSFSVTRPADGPSTRYGILDNLFKRIFEGNGQNDTTTAKFNNMQEEPEQLKVRQKPKEINRSGSIFKIHPYEQSAHKNIGDSDGRRQYFVQSILHYFPELLNARDILGIEANLKDGCIDNCTFKTPALKEPVVGVNHIVEMYKSILRVCADMQIEIINHDEEEIDGSIVLSSNHFLTGMHM